MDVLNPIVEIMRQRIRVLTHHLDDGFYLSSADDRAEIEQLRSSIALHCKNCHMLQFIHLNGKCLFEPTHFESLEP